MRRNGGPYTPINPFHAQIQAQIVGCTGQWGFTVWVNKRNQEFWSGRCDSLKMTHHPQIWGCGSGSLVFFWVSTPQQQLGLLRDITGGALASSVGSQACSMHQRAGHLLGGPWQAWPPRSHTCSELVSWERAELHIWIFITWKGLGKPSALHTYPASLLVSSLAGASEPVDTC